MTLVDPIEGPMFFSRKLLFRRHPRRVIYYYFILIKRLEGGAHTGCFCVLYYTYNWCDDESRCCTQDSRHKQMLKSLVIVTTRTP